MTLEEKIKYLKINNINYSTYNYMLPSFDICDNKLVLNNIEITERNYDFYKNLLADCIINGNLKLPHLESIPNNFLNNSIINGFLNLSSLKEIPLNTMYNLVINNGLYYGILYLDNLEYLPKGFCPDVRSKIWLTGLKSKILSDLILYPGLKRELGFNLLKNV